MVITGRTRNALAGFRLEGSNPSVSAKFDEVTPIYRTSMDGGASLRSLRLETTGFRHFSFSQNLELTTILTTITIKLILVFSKLVFCLLVFTCDRFSTLGFPTLGKNIEITGVFTLAEQKKSLFEFY